jgi:hypothetical protein
MPQGRMIRSLLIALFLGVCSAGAWAQSPQAQQKDQGPPIIKKSSKHSGAPVVGDFERQPGSDADEVRRQMREQRYGRFLPHAFTDPGPLVDGKPESSVLSFIDFATINSSDPHGLPASSSNAIVIGTVVSGMSFINKDHNRVYSDYHVKIDEILKPDPTANLAAGDEVVASRGGGAIRFPSGHVTYFLRDGHGLPEVGSQYVLFLSRSIPSLPEYEIVFASGYQLKSGRVYPLDDMNEEYDAMSAPVFLDLVRKAIAASPKGGKS